MQSKVTVLTCVYNGLPYLKEAIDSTLNQSYKNFEYLIIDDASPDENVIKLIESYNDPRIRLVRNKKNLGVSNTINKALKLIKTKYVVRIDQDDVNLPNRIEQQIDYLEKNPTIDIVCSWEHTINSEGRKLRSWTRLIDNYGSFLGYILIRICPIWHPSIAFKTKVLIDIGGFDVDYKRAEDFEVTARLAINRYNAAVVNEFHLLQRQHDKSQSAVFIQEMEEFARLAHQEVINKFSTHDDVKMLGNFLRIEKNQNNNKLTKDNLIRVHAALNNLINNITITQKLNNIELASMKKIIYRRVGFGIRYIHILAVLPSLLFYPIYYLFSPLRLSFLRIIISKFYRYYLKIVYIFK